MSILVSNEILTSIKQELMNAKASVQIMTAYCKKDSFVMLNNCISSSVTDKKLLLRFRLDDLVKGSTDFDVLDTARNDAWNVYVRFDLHAKTYIIDQKRGIVGSANMTNSGLSQHSAGNMEMATLVNIESQDLQKIERLYNDSILVDDEIYKKMKEQYLRVDHSAGVNKLSWDDDITEKFKPTIETLFSYELPDSGDIKEGDYLSFIDYKFDGDMNELRDTFRWSNSFMWLQRTLKENGGALYFGSLSEKLHNALITDPKPYRRDVKTMLANMLSIIEFLEMPEIKIDRPNYSQRIQLTNNT